MNGSFLQLVPEFVIGATKLHTGLVNFAFLCCVAHLLIMANQAYREHSIHSIQRGLVKIVAIIMAITGLSSWGDMLKYAVDELVATVGTPNDKVFESYKQIIERNFGTGSVPSFGGTSSSNQSSNGIHITKYGYAGDPYTDQNSRNGKGAFNDNHLVANESAALSPDVAERFNVQPGQSFTVQLDNGATMNLVYADKTREDLTNRVDIFTPSGDLPSDGAEVSSLTLGGMTTQLANNNNIGTSFLAHLDPFGLFMRAIVFTASLLAIGIMWLMNGIRQILYVLEWAVSPIFIGMFAVPALSNIGMRFILSFTSLCLWPLGWVISDLVTRVLLEWCSNGFFYGYFLLVAMWVVISSVVAPWLISKSLMSGSSGVMALAGTTAWRTISVGQTAAAPVSTGVSTAIGTLRR
jgi:hypothetical protein